MVFCGGDSDTVTRLEVDESFTRGLTEDLQPGGVLLLVTIKGVLDVRIGVLVDAGLDERGHELLRVSRNLHALISHRDNLLSAVYAVGPYHGRIRGPFPVRVMAG